MTDREALNEFLRGVAVTIGIVGVLILFIAFISTPESPQNGVESPKFGVVDQYKNCDVVRYTDPSNRYRYFLDCSKQ
jgi:hypothetical protein